MAIGAPATNPASDLELKLPATIGAADYVLKNSSTAGTLELSASINTPIVFAYTPATTQGLTDATWTKNSWLTTEEIDTDSAFASSTFTVPTGKGGTYYIQCANNLYGDSNNIRGARTSIYKNGSKYGRSYNAIFSTSSSGLRHYSATQQVLAVLAAGDTIENYMILDVESGPAYMSSDDWGVRGNHILIYRLSA